VTSLTAARQALFAQKEGNSDEPLGLSGPFLLVIPIELEDTALGINNSQSVPGTTDGSANPWYHRFGDHGERIFTNPLLVDGDDWCLFDVGGNAGIVELCFLNGVQSPQVIVSDDPREGQSFTQDRICYRLRFEFECDVIDYRGAYKSVVG
jgi:hypothetical protein